MLPTPLASSVTIPLTRSKPSGTSSATEDWPAISFVGKKPERGFYVDFCCVEARLLVELDGMSHVATGEKDDQKSKCLERDGYRVIRFTNDEVLQSIDAVADEILRELGRARP